MYLVIHSRSDVVNATRALSKDNNGANPAAFEELLHLIRYVLDTKNFGMKLEPTRNAKKPLEIVCFSYSNYVEDPISRRSLSGFILCVPCVTFS